MGVLCILPRMHQIRTSRRNNYNSMGMIAQFFHKILGRYRDVWSDRRFLGQLIVGIGILIVSLFLNYAANIYTTLHVGVSAQDILLDHLPTINLDDIYIEGAAILLGFICLLGLQRPRRIPFMLKTIGLFIAIRSFFIVLTHLSVPLTSAEYDLLYAPSGGFMQKLSGGNDLFFSGHTGLPFLMALMFWEYGYLRIGFLIASVVFGAAVLLAHVHYSIDVFSAFFITYAIYHMALWMFKKDRESFEGDLRTVAKR